MEKRPHIVLILAVATWAAIVVAAPSSAQVKLQRFERDTLSIETGGGERHRFEVEVALTDAQHAQGLMYRRNLAEDAGMLFLYRGAGTVSMWMKNTTIPLDMMFIAPDGRIVDIAERTVPYSLETVSSRYAASAVLEVNGGTIARLGIQPGDRVRYRAFGGGS
jgi:uncharacterized membrane protein (UPF0127 family)